MNITVKANPCFKEVDMSRERYIVMKGVRGKVILQPQGKEFFT